MLKWNYLWQQYERSHSIICHLCFFSDHSFLLCSKLSPFPSTDWVPVTCRCWQDANTPANNLQRCSHSLLALPFISPTAAPNWSTASQCFSGVRLPASCYWPWPLTCQHSSGLTSGSTYHREEHLLCELPPASQLTIVPVKLWFRGLKLPAPKLNRTCNKPSRIVSAVWIYTEYRPCIIEYLHIWVKLLFQFIPIAHFLNVDHNLPPAGHT